MEEVFNAKEGTADGDEAELLAVLVEKYEDEHYPIKAPDPIEAIKFRMEQMNMDKKDLAKIIGYKSRVSEIFTKKRKLNLKKLVILRGRSSRSIPKTTTQPPGRFASCEAHALKQY